MNQARARANAASAERSFVMKRKWIGVIMGCSLLLGSFAMTGCNMFRGMARDSQETIDALQVGPHQAYHQTARDF
jgi:predicted small secreted protein